MSPGKAAVEKTEKTVLCTLKEENMPFLYFLLSHKRANECVNLLPLFLGR